jgi:hypothetical protein
MGDPNGQIPPAMYLKVPDSELLEKRYSRFLGCLTGREIPASKNASEFATSPNQSLLRLRASRMDI